MTANLSRKSCEFRRNFWLRLWLVVLLFRTTEMALLLSCPVMPPCFCDTRATRSLYVKKIVCANVGRTFPRFVDNGEYVDTITLIYADLRHIPGGAFTNLRVIKIELQGNNFGSKIDMRAFYGVSNHLRTLNIEWSNITFLNHKVFRGMIELRNLSLAENKLWYLHPSLFQDLRSLRRLHLAGNHFNYISPYTFRYQTNLEILDLGYCNMRSLPTSLFAGLWNLEILDLRGNGLKLLFPRTFEDLWSLEILQLSHNPIRQLRQRIFEGLTNLQTLDLQEGSIQYISSGVFLDTPNLRKLHLADNKLHVIDHAVLGVLQKLEWLSLDGNTLSRLPSDMSNLVNMVKLDVSYNNFTAMDRCIFQNFKKMNFLNLQQNPFHCDCSLFWLRSLQMILVRRWDRASRIPFVPGKCASPPKLNGIGVTGWLDMDCMKGYHVHKIHCASPSA